MLQIYFTEAGMYIFEIGNYEASLLYTETEKLLCKRLEACSRKTLPGVWRFTDGANSYAKKDPVGKGGRCGTAFTDGF